MRRNEPARSCRLVLRQRSKMIRQRTEPATLTDDIQTTNRNRRSPSKAPNSWHNARRNNRTSQPTTTTTAVAAATRLPSALGVLLEAQRRNKTTTENPTVEAERKKRQQQQQKKQTPSHSHKDSTTHTSIRKQYSHVRMYRSAWIATMATMTLLLLLLITAAQGFVPTPIQTRFTSVKASRFVQSHHHHPTMPVSTSWCTMAATSSSHLGDLENTEKDKNGIKNRFANCRQRIRNWASTGLSRLSHQTRRFCTGRQALVGAVLGLLTIAWPRLAKAMAGGMGPAKPVQLQRYVLSNSACQHRLLVGNSTPS